MFGTGLGQVKPPITFEGSSSGRNAQLVGPPPGILRQVKVPETGSEVSVVVASHEMTFPLLLKLHVFVCTRKSNNCIVPSGGPA